MNFHFVPGTTMPYSEIDGSAFKLFEPMLAATGGLSLSQVCSITGLEGSTVQNWIKRGIVAKPIEKKYYERHLARILLVNALRESMQLDKIKALLKYLNGLVDDESDDIIREAQLYDYLCIIIMNIDFEKGFSNKSVADSVEDVIKDYSGPHADSKTKLFKGLTLMTLGFVSGRIKQEADLLYDELMN